MRIDGGKKRIMWIAILFVAIFAASYFVFPEKHTDTVGIQYSSFYQEVEKGNVEWAEISGNRVYFQVKGDTQEYSTTNPQYDQFREFLLLHDVAIVQTTDMDSILYLIMDMMFNLMFFSIIIGAAVWLIRRSKKQFPVIRKTNCSFDQIAGMDEVKTDMMQLVEVLKHPQEYARRGIRPPHGILLAGPPGNGKTLFARALAGEAGMNFIATKATDFQSMYMSIGPSKVRSLFRKARKKSPCIVFIDEFDGLGEKRNYAGQGIDKENNRIITAMLNELDGFEQRPGDVVVIAATNNIRDLDPALVRPGRFDRKYAVANPDTKTRRLLIQMYLKDKKLGDDVSMDELVNDFMGSSCAAIEAVINEAFLSASARNSQMVQRIDLDKAFRIVEGREDI